MEEMTRAALQEEMRAVLVAELKKLPDLLGPDLISRTIGNLPLAMFIQYWPRDPFKVVSIVIALNMVFLIVLNWPIAAFIYFAILSTSTTILFVLIRLALFRSTADKIRRTYMVEVAADFIMKHVDHPRDTVGHVIQEANVRCLCNGCLERNQDHEI